MFYLNSLHKDIKHYYAIISLHKNNNIINYEIVYTELKRTLTIQFENVFPNKILGWKETYTSGYGSHKKELTTEASKIKDLKVAYWNKKFNKDRYLRDSLGL